MISIVICSINDAKFDAVSRMYGAQFANVPHEIIRIADARSLAEGYTRGMAKSRGEVLILSHDDVEILSPDFAATLQNHLDRFDMIGVAGTDRLIGPRWIISGIPHIFGQVAFPIANQPGQLNVDVFGAPRRVVANIQALDGLFIAMHRRVLDCVSFDATNFDGFHLYDLDFSYAAFQAGVRIAVANDLNLIHHSGGDYDAETWKKYAQRFIGKWQGKLPKVVPARGTWASMTAPSREEAMRIMRPGYWDQ